MTRASSPRSQQPRNAELADLLMRVAEVRDKTAFSELFEHFGPRIKGFMMRKGADAELAEDLAQDTMITVWRKAHMYSREKGTVSTWIFTIARNRRIDWARRADNVQLLTSLTMTRRATIRAPTKPSPLRRRRAMLQRRSKLCQKTKSRSSQWPLWKT